MPGCQIYFILLPNIPFWIEIITGALKHCLFGVLYLHLLHARGYTVVPGIFKVLGQPRGGGGHSNMKVTYKCLPENENRGHSVYDFVEKRGSFGVGTKKNGGFFGVDSQKWGSFSVQKYNFKAKFANFLLKLPQNCYISQNARRKACKNLQFLCKIWYKSGKKGVIGCGLNEKRGSLGVGSA